MIIADNVATLEGGEALVTVVVYVCVVVPSCAVTTVVIVLLPTLKLIAPLALPLATVVPFTFTVALLSVTVGVTVILLVALDTDAV
jgi:hypothetical protein